MKIGVCHNQLALFVQWQSAPVIGEWMNYHGGILPCLDHLIQIADCAMPRRLGQRAVQPACAIGIQQIASDQIGSGHVLVASHRNQWFAEFPRHVLDEARFAATGRAFQHHRQARRVGGFV